MGNIGLVSKIHEPNIEIHKDWKCTEIICKGYFIKVEVNEENIESEITLDYLISKKNTHRFSSDLIFIYDYSDNVLTFEDYYGDNWTIYTDDTESLFRLLLHNRTGYISHDSSPENFYMELD